MNEGASGRRSFRIPQDLGLASKGCRLDPNVDLLSIDKLGKHEADGRGFRTIIADALELDVPVLVGVNTLNLSAFEGFVRPEVTRSEPSERLIHESLATVLSGKKDVA
mgnify:CR=1 FL=1